MNSRFVISFLITFVINLACSVFSAKYSEPDMCNAGAGILFGIFIFVPLTLTCLLVFGILWLIYKNEIFKGIALAELITVIVLTCILTYNSFY
jgi:hypothetical protein